MLSLSIQTTAEKLQVRFLTEPDVQQRMPAAIAELSDFIGEVFKGDAAGCPEVVVLAQAAALRLALPRVIPHWSDFATTVLTDLVTDVTVILTLLDGDKT